MGTIAFLFRAGRMPRLAAGRRGEAPREFFYGALDLEAAGQPVRIIEIDDAAPPHWPCAALNFLGDSGPVKLDGAVFEATGNCLRELRDCDCVVGTTGAISFALAAWKLLGRMPAPLVGIHCGLLNHPINRLRRSTTSALLRRMEVVLFGASEYEPLRAAFPAAAARLHVNQFGVDAEYWTPGPAPASGHILAVGNDGQRDYPALLEAAKALSLPVIILTARDLPAPLPPGVRHLRGDYSNANVSDAELRNLYRGAACVVVPLKQTVQPSGQSVTLQAMACGRPVVLTETGGLWSRETVCDGRTLLLTPPGDAARLARTIRRVTDDPALAAMLGANARQAVLANATSRAFADRLLTICRQAGGRR